MISKNGLCFDRAADAALPGDWIDYFALNERFPTCLRRARFMGCALADTVRCTRSLLDGMGPPVRVAQDAAQRNHYYEPDVLVWLVWDAERRLRGDADRNAAKLVAFGMLYGARPPALRGLAAASGANLSYAELEAMALAHLQGES